MSDMLAMADNSSSSGDSAAGTVLPVLPPQYLTGGLGLFWRQMETSPTAVTVGPDGALYVGELTGMPSALGYSNVIRIGDPAATTGFDGSTPSGVPQTYASGFTQVISLGFDAQGTLYVLQYLNANTVLDPSLTPADLPPSQLVKVTPDGKRTTVSGPELKLADYLLVDKASSDVYVAVNNASSTDGEVLRYHTDPATGTVTHEVVASGLNGPRGMAFGPDGKLYVLEVGNGTPSDAPGAADASLNPFVPGLSQRGGYTGSITSVDISGDGAQERVFTGLPSFLVFDSTTNQDTTVAVGANALTITPDGTAYIAAGIGFTPKTAAAVSPFGDDLQGVLKLTGLFGDDPSQAAVTPAFNSLAYGAANSPDGAATQFNTESNLYDITQGSDGNLYAVDAARNVVYGLSSDGSTVQSATVLQKQPYVLTPPQYAAVVAAGGNPSAQYAAEISSTTTKNADGLPDVPGNPPTTTDASGASQPYPGPTDPVVAPVQPDNPYTRYFDPYFGNYAPATSEPLAIPGGHGSTYTVSQLYSFGDRLSDTGNTAALEKSLGQDTPLTSPPFSVGGDFSDGPNWTTILGQILGVQPSGAQTNFAYESATARPIPNPFDPNQNQTTLGSFQGQIEQFEQGGTLFSPDDLVTVNFGDYDLVLPSTLPPDVGIELSVDAILGGLQQLADLGAQHFLVANLRFVTLDPPFGDPTTDDAFGVLYDQFNAGLQSGLQDFQACSGLDVKELDLNSLFNNIVVNPSDYGFTNVTQPLLSNGTSPGSVVTYNPAIVGQDPAVEHSTLTLDPFFDPTALGQAIIAQTARDTLTTA